MRIVIVSQYSVLPVIETAPAAPKQGAKQSLDQKNPDNGFEREMLSSRETGNQSRPDHASRADRQNEPRDTKSASAQTSSSSHEASRNEQAKSQDSTASHSPIGKNETVAAQDTSPATDKTPRPNKAPANSAQKSDDLLATQALSNPALALMAAQEKLAERSEKERLLASTSEFGTKTQSSSEDDLLSLLAEQTQPSSGGKAQPTDQTADKGAANENNKDGQTDGSTVNGTQTDEAAQTASSDTQDTSLLSAIKNNANSTADAQVEDGITQSDQAQGLKAAQQNAASDADAAAAGEKVDPSILKANTVASTKNSEDSITQSLSTHEGGAYTGAGDGNTPFNKETGSETKSMIPQAETSPDSTTNGKAVSAEETVTAGEKPAATQGQTKNPDQASANTELSKKEAASLNDATTKPAAQAQDASTTQVKAEPAHSTNAAQSRAGAEQATLAQQQAKELGGQPNNQAGNQSASQSGSAEAEGDMAVRASDGDGNPSQSDKGNREGSNTSTSASTNASQTLAKARAPKGAMFSEIMGQIKNSSMPMDLASLEKNTGDFEFLPQTGSDPSVRLTGMETFARTGQIPQAAAQANAQAIAAQIARQARGGENRFEIRLDPAELGKIDVKLTIGSDGQARAHLFVERPETMDFLMRDQRMLERALQQSGLQLDEKGLEFSMMDQQNNGQQMGEQTAEDQSQGSDKSVGQAQNDDNLDQSLQGQSHLAQSYMATEGLNLVI